MRDSNPRPLASKASQGGFSVQNRTIQNGARSRNSSQSVTTVQGPEIRTDPARHRNFATRLLPRDRLLTAVDVSQRLGVSAATVYRLTSSGKLPCIRIGASIRVRPETLEAYLAAGEKPSKKPRRSRG